MRIVKTVLVFIGSFIGAAIAWSIVTFTLASVLGATMNEAGEFETSATPWLAIVTAFIVTYMWRKRRRRRLASRQPGETA